MFIVEECPHQRATRIGRGLKVLVEVDAAAFRAVYERQTGRPLAWNEWRAQRLVDVVALDAFPCCSWSRRYGVDVADGRHRIAEAARRGTTITVAVANQREARGLKAALAAN